MFFFPLLVCFALQFLFEILNDNLCDLQSKSPCLDKGYSESDPTIYVLCGFRGAHNRLNLQRP